MSADERFLYNGYDYQVFSVPHGAVDQDITPSNQPLRSIGYAIIDTNRDIVLKFNSASNPARPLLAIDSPLIYNGLHITKILVSNTSGGVATVKVDVAGLKASA